MATTASSNSTGFDGNLTTTAAPESIDMSNDLGTTTTPRPTSTFLVRLILENWVATNPVLLEASKCGTLEDLFSLVQASIPLARRSTVMGQKLVAPLFILQETGEATKAHRGTQFTFCNFRNKVGYSRWRSRCANNQTAKIPKIEVRLRSARCATLEHFDEIEDLQAGRVGEGQEVFFTRRYGRYEAEPITHATKHNWVVHSKDTDTIKDEDLDAVDDSSAPSAYEWFHEGDAYAEEAISSK